MDAPNDDPPRLLVVEDSPLDRELYRRSLARFAAEFSPTGEDALGRLAAERFDLVVLDYGLPGLDGGDVLDAIRHTLRLDLPVVVVTGSGSEALAADLLRRGASDYIVKDVIGTPALPSAIVAAIERHRLASDRERAQRELKAQRDELAEALRKLQEAQAHLIQSEKMASLRQASSRGSPTRSITRSRMSRTTSPCWTAT